MREDCISISSADVGSSAKDKLTVQSIRTQSPRWYGGAVAGSFLAFLFPTSGYISEGLGRGGLFLTPARVRVSAGTTWQSHPTCGTPGSKNGVGKGFWGFAFTCSISVHRDAYSTNRKPCIRGRRGKGRRRTQAGKSTGKMRGLMGGCARA